MRILAVAAGGAVGAVLRYFVSSFAQTRVSGTFPVGTLVVNLCGCALIGFLSGWFEQVVLPTGVRSFVLVGVLGAFTTFSTYALETVQLLHGRAYGKALVYASVHMIAGLALVILGLAAARWLFGGGR